MRGQSTETERTGDTAEQVKQAALAAVPGGTIIRVETDADGSPYEAHVRKSDGTEVVVKVDENFNVTAVEEFAGGRHGGPGGRRGPGGDCDDDTAGDNGTGAAPAAPAATDA